MKRLMIIISAIFAVAACGNDGGGSATNAGPGADMSVDADNAITPDAGLDVGNDAGSDAGADLGPDAFDDAGSMDVGPDLAPAVDEDRDDDGVDDDDDAFPDDATEWIDSDGDGVGNLAQADEDGDGVADIDDPAPFDPAITAVTPIAHPSDGSTIELMGAAPYVVQSVRASDGFDVVSAAFTNDDMSAFAVSATASQGDVEVVVRHESNTFDEAVDIVHEGPSTQTIAWVPRQAGRFVVRVFTDAAAAEVVDFTIVRDRDIDGLGDDFELAVGMRPDNADPDADGLTDFAEWQLAKSNIDLDADGFPAWLDADQDGDGLRDATEGLRDPDGDGLPNAIDDDSDDNGVLDSNEPAVADVFDWDSDGIADYEDLDDDADMLFDVWDPDPRATDVWTDGYAQTTPLVLSNSVGTFGVVPIDNAVRSGDALVVSGTGFDAGSAPVAILIYETGVVDNITPTVVTPTTFTIQPVVVGRADLLIVQAGVASARLPVDVLHPQAPVIYPPADNAIDVANGRLTVTGENLQNVSRLEAMDGSLIDCFYSTFDQTLNANEFSASRVRPIEGSLRGNTIEIRPIQNFSFQVDVPTTASFVEAELTLFGRPDESVDTSNGGVWTVTSTYEKPAIATATVDAVDPAPVMFSTHHSISGFPVGSQMSMLTTAATWAMEINGARSRLANDKHWEAYEAVLARTEVVTLSGALQTAAETTTDYLTAPSATLQAALIPAVEAAEEEIAARIPVAMPIRQTAIITPGEQADVAPSQTANSGNLTIENDTSVYLSAEVLDKAGRPLQTHVTGFVDQRMIGTQAGLTFLFNAASANLAAPNYRNADLEIVTPGLAMPQPTGARSVDAQTYVLLRTIVDKIVLPAISLALDGAFEDLSLPIKLLLLHNYAIVQDVKTAAAAGDARGAVSVVVSALMRDIENLGPFTTAVVTAIAKGAASTETVKKYAARLVPVLGQMEQILSVAGTIGTTVGILKAVDDFLNTPGVLRWQVDFGLEITAAEPNVVERRHRRQEICLLGAGFRQGDGLTAAVSMLDVGSMTDITIRDYDANPDGTKLCFGVESGDAAQVAGPLEVTLTRSDTNESASTTLSVFNDFALAGILDYTGGSRESVRLTGGGFGTDASDLEVRFQQPDTGDVVAAARVTQAHGSWLRFEMPGTIRHEVPYDIFVARGPVGAQEFTNVLPINVRYPTLDGRWVVSWDATFYRLVPGGCELITESGSGWVQPPNNALTFLTPWDEFSAGAACNVGMQVTQAPADARDGMISGEQSFGAPNGCDFQPFQGSAWNFSGHLRKGKIRFFDAGGPFCSATASLVTVQRQQ